MRLRRCDFCGAEIADSMIMFKEGSVNPDHEGWGVIERYDENYNKIKEDICKKCIKKAQKPKLKGKPNVEKIRNANN